MQSQHFFDSRTSSLSDVVHLQAQFRAVFNLGPDFPADGRPFDRLLDAGEGLDLGGFGICAMHTPGPCESSVGEQKRSNVQLDAKTSKEAFVRFRRTRDATLEMPALILPAIQVKIRAGHLPEPEANGISYLKLPVNVFGDST